MDRCRHTVVQIRNLNLEVALHSMLFALHPNKFVYSLCKKPPSSMDKLHNRAKGYIQMEEKSRFWNEVRQAIQKRDMHKANTKANLHKLDKRHKPDKSQLLFKGPRYERYTPLTINRMMILKEAFNLEVPIWLPQTKAPRPGSNKPNTVDITVRTSKGAAQKLGRKQTEEEQKIEADKGTSNNDVSDNLHHSRNLPNTSEPSLLPINFMDRDSKGINPVNQDDPMKTFQRLEFSPNTVHPHTGSLLGFAAPYPPIQELAMPYPTVAEGTQVMKRDEGSQIRALTIYQSSLGSEFDTDLQDDTSDKDPKLIEELVQLQPGPKPR
ncbi:hypothetical protein JHK85_050963 [Glycine max]|nr:hypothetical protein JHK85_050963 [Glycine max]